MPVRLSECLRVQRVISSVIHHEVWMYRECSSKVLAQVVSNVMVWCKCCLRPAMPILTAVPACPEVGVPNSTVLIILTCHMVEGILQAHLPLSFVGSSATAAS